MQRFSLLAVAPAALALALVAAACGAAPAASPSASPNPTAAPTGTPVVTPVPSDAPAPSDAPSADPGDGAIVLDVADDHDVSVVVTDRGAGLAGARSGTARDGMSVRWGDATVKNLDPKTIEVTWVGFAQDDTIGLVVEPKGDGVLLRFGQDAPYPNTDALGADRVMVFTFAEPVSADQVDVEFTTADD
jgi:hypothetical protein